MGQHRAEDPQLADRIARFMPGSTPQLGVGPELGNDAPALAHVRVPIVGLTGALPLHGFLPGHLAVYLLGTVSNILTTTTATPTSAATTTAADATTTSMCTLCILAYLEYD